MPNGEATAHLFRPKLITTLSEGYDLGAFRHDLTAAVTVAIVALPLSMAIAVASGVSPDRGLFTAIVGGFVVSALSGSRFQIGGPAGAFITLMASTAASIGLEGLLVAVLLSGAMLVVLGALRIGSLVRYMPHAVTVGFTSGIAVTILVSQLKDLGGLRLAGAEPGPIIPKLGALAHAASTFNIDAFAVGAATAAIIFGLRKTRPNWPGMLIAVAAAALITMLGGLPVETIASRFGSIPRGLPWPALPAMSGDLVMRALPAAFSFTLLGAVESLLSAKVADAMTGRKHRSNMELIGQGVANMASACFGGLCVTGTIARTATNIRAGAKSPISGMLHAVILLLFMIIAAPLAGYIPLPALAGVLVAVCWNMAEKAEFARLLRAWPTGLVLTATFALTIVRDLTAGIVAGCVLAALLAWLRRPAPAEGV
ncbi:MAG TPA: SulP family inorganic anion transporter [Caulobacterales bacterium]|nr:SulP family inorganic anion transporter [Caulobacterales bacterium]